MGFSDLERGQIFWRISVKYVPTFLCRMTDTGTVRQVGIGMFLGGHVKHFSEKKGKSLVRGRQVVTYIHVLRLLKKRGF